MGILDGKNILVTGVTMNTSIAYKVAEVAEQQGATVIVTAFGRALRLATKVVQKLDPVPQVIELDASNADELAALPGKLRELGFDHVDGVLHSIAFANPERALGGAFLKTGWDDVAVSLHTSTYSYVSLAMAVRELMSADHRSWASPSTPRSAGRPMTGWAWRRPASSRRTVTSRATSA